MTAVVPTPGAVVHALSPAQERLWVLHRLDPASTAFQMSVGTRMRGPLDVPALAAAVTAVVHRHPALRTRIAAVDGEPYAVVDPPGPVPLAQHDVAHEARPEDAARALLVDDVTTPMDLATDRLVRPVLVHLGPDDHVFSWVAHHVVTDGTSFSVMTGDLVEAYRQAQAGRVPVLPPAPHPAEWIARWREARDAGRHEQALAFFTAMHTPPVPPLELPTDRPRPHLPSGEGRRETVPLTTPSALFTATVTREGMSGTVVGLALFVAALHRWTGTTDVCVGLPAKVRDAADAELVGMYVNTLPLRLRVDPAAAFSELLQAVQAVARPAFRARAAEFDVVLERLRRPRAAGRHPLFDVQFQLFGQFALQPAFPGVTVEEFRSLRPRADCDLTLEIDPQHEHLRARVAWSSDLFDRASVMGVLHGLDALARAALEHPDTPVGALPFPTLTDTGTHPDTVAVPVAFPPAGHTDVPEPSPATPPSVVVLPADDGDVTVTDDLVRALTRRLGGVGGVGGEGAGAPVLALPTQAHRAIGGRARPVTHRVAGHLADVHAHVARHPSPGTPPVLIGVGGGAVLAIEVARSLGAEGSDVGLVVLLDPGWLHPSPESRDGIGGARGATLDHLRRRAGRRVGELGSALRTASTTTAALPTPARSAALLADTVAAVGAHRVLPYDGAVLFVRAAHSPVAALGRWRAVCRGPFAVHVAPGHHDGPDGFLARGRLDALADVLADAIRTAIRTATRAATR